LTRRIFSWLVGGLWALFALTLGRFWGIRFGLLDARQIGHLALFPDQAYSEKVATGELPNLRRVLWEIITPISNTFLLEIWRSKFVIKQSYFGVKSACGILRFIGRGDLTLSTSNYFGSTHSPKQDDAPLLHIDSHSRDKALSLLRTRVEDFDFKRLVCLHVRDDLYHDVSQISSHKALRGSLRNPPFHSFQLAIEQLCDQGYTVCLLGTHSHDTSVLRHRGFIDLQKLKDAGDSSIDIVLIADCRFYVSGTVSGLMEVAKLFRRPILFLNYWPLASLPKNYGKSAVYPLPVYNANTEDLVSIRELFEYEAAVLLEIRKKRFRNVDFSSMDMLSNRPDWRPRHLDEWQVWQSISEFSEWLASDFSLDVDLLTENKIFLEELPSVSSLLPNPIRISSQYLESYRDELNALRAR